MGTALVGVSAEATTELGALRAELRQIGRGLVDGVWSLAPTQRRRAAWLLAGLTALRLYFSLFNPEYDDAVSYEVFVSKGLLVTSAYYPIPNNHVLSNAISLLFYQISPAFWWSMRLPVLIISTVATIFLFAATLRRTSYLIALVGTGLFSLLQLSLYHAGVGRGYWLLIGLAGIVFFSMMELLAARGRRRAAWAGLAVAGVLGCYTIPTFVYVLASAFSWLGLAFLPRAQWPRLRRLVGVAVLIGWATALLYAPLLLVSGLRIFARNGYVETLAPAVFWPNLPVYLWHNEGFLAGQRSVGALVTLTVLPLVGYLFYLARAGRLPAPQAQRLRTVGLPALWFVGLPYAALFVQRVFPPERVLLYKAFFFFVLVGMVVDWVMWRWPAPTHRWPRRALTTLAGLFALYQTFTVVRVNPTARSTNASYRAGLLWLAARPPGPVLVPEPTHNLFFRFYAHTQARQRPWRIDNEQRPGRRYDYVVAFPNKRGFFQPRFTFAPAYHDENVEIYTVPPGFPLETAPWRH
ncbi:hypothetical protein [Hymenobacter sp.]|uniref:hypothetical protein n=1 Tax=Hymenobacter sp. TaxID=1898978 RepID=UPI00286C190F|nr:hypothetical protein [Hymenobacter sp.]